MGNNLTPVVKILLILNVGIFLIAGIFDSPAFEDFMALHYFASPDFKIHQIITHMFMHGGTMHLFGNMLGLFFFGPILESRWGPKRFLLYYLVCGIGGALCYTGVKAYEFNKVHSKIEAYYQNPDPDAYEVIATHQFKFFYDRYPNSYEFKELPEKFKLDPKNPELIAESKNTLSSLYQTDIRLTRVIGASGAIFGILLGFALLFPNTPIMLLFFPVPIKAKYLITFYGLYEVYRTIINNPDDTVAHVAHLGGMLFGFLLIEYWKRSRDSFY